MVAALFVVPALGQAVALMGGGRPGIEVGRVVGEQSPVDQLFLFPSRQQSELRLFQFIGPAARIGFDADPIQGIPKILGAVLFGRKVHSGCKMVERYQSATSVLRDGSGPQIHGEPSAKRLPRTGSTVPSTIL